ncbi:SusC/RagA family TonB-linked outer membrane protein [Sphingobacterium sp. HJSM2_6]|uniref:SusC/RagA family TonB-linked outer membrane protein n=1 Tax=Sphingobacterium sp. HJSM2_6 TaxID=3366264 RepID=UPI003BBF3D70
MKQKLLGFIFVWACFIGIAFAQDRQVSGKVTSLAGGSPLGGVSVMLVGSSNATQTDAQGNFSIEVGPNATLAFSYVGYTTKRVNVGNQTDLNVQLVADEMALEEVVVVGYGSTTKEAFTGSAKKVDGAKLQAKNVSNISQAIAGEVAGLQVVNGSGQPGTAATIRIRGFGSVNGSRDPLYVVDGVPFAGNITSINNNDIENVTVLKDAAATAIYGSRGANGVILISTKTGKGKSSFVEADVNIGSNMSLLPRYDVLRSAEDYIGLSWESMHNEGVNAGEDGTAYANENLFSGKGLDPLNNLWNITDVADLIDPLTRTVKAGVTRKFDPENWKDYAFQSAIRKDFNVRFGGSNDKTNYFTSLGYLGDQGYSINSDFERFTGRLNLDHQVNNWIKVGMNTNYSRVERNTGGQSEDSGSVFWFVDNMPSIYPLFERDANGNKIDDTIFGGYVYDYGINNARKFGSLTNAIADATYDVKRHKRNELNGRAYINFDIIEGLTFENSLGIQYYNNIYTDRGNKFYGSSASQNGSLYQSRTEMSYYNLLNLLRYRKDFGNHSIEGLAAHEAVKWNSNVLNVSGYNLVDNNILDFNNVVVSNPVKSYTESYALESYFAQVNYDYSNKYYLSGSLRRDGSSRFKKHKWGTFGSIGAGWIISNEDFMKDQDLFNFLKYKISYGVIGDQAGVGYYPGYDLYSVDNLNNSPAFSFLTKGNEDLTWETSKMFQTGVEFELGSYLTGSVEYYIKNTDNLIFNRGVGPSLGYSTIKVNDGQLRNQGLEIDLVGHILRADDYFLDLGINAESFKNKITKMPIEPSTNLPKDIDIQGNYGWAKGHSIYDFYMADFTGVNADTGESTWKVFYTDNNDNGIYDEDEEIKSMALFKNADNKDISEATTTKYEDATRYYVGKSAIPKIRGAVNLRAGYKGVELSAQMLYSLGGYAYDGAYAALMNDDLIGGNNWHVDMFNRWQKAGDQTDVPRLTNNNDIGVNSSSSRFLTKANYLLLNNVRLGYNFNSSILKSIGAQSLGVWVSADNLAIASARKGFNPSTHQAGSSSTYRYSPLSTISAGLRVKF